MPHQSHHHHDGSAPQHDHHWHDHHGHGHSEQNHPDHGGHSHGGHSHGGHHHGPSNYNRAFIIGLVLNGGFVLLEFAFGFISNSVSLMADVGHNLSDVLGLLLAWMANLVAHRQPSPRYTYGWRKFSILAAFLNAVFLLVATGGIVLEAIQRLLHPSEVAGAIIIGFRWALSWRGLEFCGPIGCGWIQRLV